MTRDPLPWGDPDRDVGADMVVCLATRAFDHLAPEQAARMAAAALSRTFTIATESVSAAIVAIAEGAKATLPVVTEFADKVAAHGHVWTQPDDADAPKYPIDTRRRRPVHGRITEVDVDLDHERIGSEYERLARKQQRDAEFYRRRNWARVFPADPAGWHRPRGQGKTREHAEAVYRMAALRGGRMEVGSGYVAFYDETQHFGRGIDLWDDEMSSTDLASWSAEVWRVADLAVTTQLDERLAPYRRVVAAESGVPAALLYPDYLSGRGR